ncbi:MAG: pyridoxal-phosphate-dependent aminotransferase family protein [Acidimicrobiales bacterium]
MPLERRSQILFNPGPVNLDPQIKENLFNVELCHRQPEFEELHDRVKRRLVALAGRSATTTALSLLHGSGSLAVDAGLATFVRGKVLVVDNGLYCQRIARTLAGLDGAEVVTCSFGVGTPFDLDAIDEALRTHRPDWVATVHHETTTGILNPIDAVADLCDRHGARLFVDAVSSFGVHPVPPAAQVVCFNSAKCLESLLGVAAVLWDRELTVHPTVPILDVAAYADAMPSTPNVAAIVALDVALDILASEDRPARYRRLVQAVWDAGSRNFEPLLDERDRSWVLTSFRLSGRDPDDLFATALAHGFVIYHGQQHLRREIFRVANMGAAMSEEVIGELFDVLSP